MGTEKFNVTGMTCAACSAHVEKAVRGVERVRDEVVSLLTNSMSVTYDAPATAQAICDAVSSAGYGAQPEAAAPSRGTADAAAARAAAREALEDHETP